MKKTIENIPKRKLKEVEDLKNLIKDKKTVLITSIKNIPASQFQEIGKKLRGKAIIKVPKKSLVFRAIDSSGNEVVKKISQYIKENTAILFSDLDCFELAAELIKNKTPTKAKAGQEAPEDIEVQEGPTDLVPGPAISELGSLGIQIQIEKGKITIKEPRIIAKKGEKIKQAAADIMAKLDIKPFSIGFTPLAAFDTKENKLYLDINIDPEATIKELKEAFSKALGFAVEIGYSSDDTIKFLIGKASGHEKVLDNLLGKEEKDVSEKDKADNAQNSNDKPSEDKAPNQEEKDEVNSNQAGEKPSEQNTQSDKPEGEEKNE
ncbi:MAG: 50S ribosomal protein L10 [Nanoarchaeota archaeon]|nr:50S ribosomal protein L10 [Nanoarchaeota archaeon]MBU1028328.1 50S ribosomal protein L10 [Nanoarchaeota archaeon]